MIKAVNEADHTFPGFTNAFNLDAVKSFIMEAFRRTQKHVSLESCEITDVNYEPGHHCNILYKAKLTNRYFRTRWDQLILGKVLKKNEASHVFPKEAFYSRRLGIVFTPFPYDPLMTWLPDAYDHKIMAKKLSRLIPKNLYSIQHVNVSLMAYTPLMRATFLYEIQLLNKLTEKIESWEWIGKTNVFKPSSRVFANYWALWKASNHTIPMPKPEGFLISPQINFQEKIKGIRLGAIVNDPNIDTIIQNTAVCIAAFHKLDVPLSNVRKFEQEVKTLNRWSNVLIDLRPELKSRMEILRKNILSTMEERFCIEGPIHADFHHTNLLVKGTHVQLIDMDEVSFGDPCLDIGRFLSSLRIPSLRTYGSFDGLKPQRELFMETYLKHSSKDPRKIRLFESASLFTSAASAFRLQRTNWELEVPMLLEESEQAYRESQKNPTVSFSDKKANYCALSKESKLDWIKDEVYLKTLLAPLFYHKKNEELTQCKLMRNFIKNNFDCLTYKTKSLKKNKWIKENIEIFLHDQRNLRPTYDFIETINRKLSRTEAFQFFPQPVGYLAELGALAFYSHKGKPLRHILGTPLAIPAAIHLAKGMAALHHIHLKLDSKVQNNLDSALTKPNHLPLSSVDPDLSSKIKILQTEISHHFQTIKPKVSYLLLQFFPNLIFSEQGAHVSFPIRKRLGHPYRDVGIYAAKCLIYGIQLQKTEESKLFIHQFKDSYAKICNIPYNDLAVFEVHALLKEAELILQKNCNKELSYQLLDVAQALMLGKKN